MSDRNKLGNLTIWRNVFKKERDRESGEPLNHPDYRGKATWGNETVEIALWVNLDAGGVPLNLSGEIVEPQDGNETTY